MGPRTTVALLGAAALLCAARPALALRPEVVQAVELFEDLRYDRARVAFEEALYLEGNGPEDLAAIHLHLGLLHGAEDREDQAETHFRRALAVDPLIELPRGQPPKITRPFARAREFWGTARLGVDHSPPDRWTAGAPAALRFAPVEDRLEMVVAARLRLRRDGEEPERSYRQDGSGPYVFPVPPELLETEGVVRYRVELLGTGSSVLRAIEDDRLSVVVAPRPRRLRADGTVGTGPGDEARPEPRRFYRRWWFWTVVGVAVAGAAAGTAAALLVPGEGVEMGAPRVVD